MDTLRRSRKRNFFICQNLIFDLDLSEHAKITYTYLSRCADDEGNSFPSYKTIGEKCSFSRSTAIKAVKELKAIGLLSSENRVTYADDKAQNTSNLYTLYNEPISGFESTLGGNLPSVSPTPPPSVPDTPPVVAVLNHPSVSGEPYKYPDKNTNLMNTQSLSPSSTKIQSDREIDLEEIQNLKLIPLKYLQLPKHMEMAIKRFSYWDDKHINGYTDDFEQSTYILLVECLIEMATTKSIMKLRNDSVSSSQVLDKINKCLSTDEFSSLDFFIDQTIEDFIKGTSNTEVKAIKNYMKSCIWSSFSTYQVKFKAFFNRTYYNNIATN